MPAVNIPLYGCAYTFYLPGVISVADSLSFQITPTIAAGDFKRKIDGAALTNFTTLPAVDNAGETAIKFSCSAAEMTCDNLSWRGVDQTSPKEWMDCGDSIQPRGLPGAFDWGTAQSVTGTTLVMKSAAAYADNELVGDIVHIVNATTGIGQTCSVLSNVGSTDTLTLDSAWQTTPTGTIIYNLLPGPKAPSVLPPVNATQAGGQTLSASGTVTLPAGTLASTTNVTLSAGERNSMADALLDRDMSTGTDSGSPTVRTTRQALRAVRNKVSVSGGTATVTKEDDTTASWTAAITGTPAVTVVDPA